ncbi:class II lanthipeptide, LchA2/BrtA2 family, partial [Bacillus wiedmannii]
PDLSGGTTIPCGVGLTVEISLGVCPTTKCTSRCGSRS